MVGAALCVPVQVWVYFALTFAIPTKMDLNNKDRKDDYNKRENEDQGTHSGSNEFSQL